MLVRRVMLVTCLAVLLHPFSVQVVAQEEQRQQKTGLAPRLRPGEVKELRLPDVVITTSVHHEAKAASRDRLPFEQRLVAHVEVAGRIAGAIPFQLLLPDEWNGRLLMTGVAARYLEAMINNKYVIVKVSSEFYEAALEANDVEGQNNFADLAVHRTAEVAKAIVYAYYGADPQYSYFSGCSLGGGQSLKEAQRYPGDFDGILAASPIVDSMGLVAERVRNAQLFFPDPSKLETSIVNELVLKELNAEVVRQCDGQDGVEDGILDDPRECRFDLSQFEGLGSAQRMALQAVYDGPRNRYGQIYPGMPFGSELGWYFWKAGSLPDFLARMGSPNLGFEIGIAISKVSIFNDPAWDYSTYRFSTWEKDTQRLKETGGNANNPDLSRFKAHGGKMILWHGWADGPITPFVSIDYFEQVEERDPNVRDYFRLFLLPGVGHCGGGVGPNRVDWFAKLVQWVEEGRTPDRVIASKIDESGNVTMTRPLYPYPLRAAYRGSGSTNDAASFVVRE